MRTLFAANRSLAAICFAVLAIDLTLSEPVTAQESAQIEANVSKVLDGDTFTLSGQSRRIRVWGLDAPEWNHNGGSRAAATLEKLIGGRRLLCAVRDIDRYGRLVAQCFLPDGRDVAFTMIHVGAAVEYCRYSRGYYGTC